jgi:hypothetical protein
MGGGHIFIRRGYTSDSRPDACTQVRGIGREGCGEGSTRFGLVSGEDNVTSVATLEVASKVGFESLILWSLRAKNK